MNLLIIEIKYMGGLSLRGKMKNLMLDKFFIFIIFNWSYLCLYIVI